MQISDYLLGDFDDTLQRLDGQVLDLVPLDRQLERFPESNSIAWAVFHIARHAELTLAVLGASAGREASEQSVDGLDERAWAGGSGLQETQQAWFGEPDPASVRRYADGVFGTVKSYLAGVDDPELSRTPDVAAALNAAGVPVDEFGWLYRMWSGQPAAFFVRWPLTSHLVHHIGEMITYRNQMGLSPFR